jgi:hypothetical protein
MTVFIVLLWDRIIPILKFYIFEKIPFLERKPFTCPVCLSWWVGLIISGMFYNNLIDLFIIPILAVLQTILILRLYIYE